MPVEFGAWSRSISRCDQCSRREPHGELLPGRGGSFLQKLTPNDVLDWPSVRRSNSLTTEKGARRSADLAPGAIPRGGERRTSKKTSPGWSRGDLGGDVTNASDFTTRFRAPGSGLEAILAPRPTSTRAMKYTVSRRAKCWESPLPSPEPDTPVRTASRSHRGGRGGESGPGS
jgi:hypothetical protein